MQDNVNLTIPSAVIDEDKRAVLVSKEYTLSEQLLKEPLRNSFKIDALCVDSFCELVNEYKEPSSKLFFDDRRICCIIDFNQKDKAEFCEKRINLDLAYTPYFEAFSQALQKDLGQREFVALLKSLYLFITAIDGVKNDNMDVIELAESLQAVKKFDSVQKNTSSKFSLDVEIKSGAKEALQLPKRLTFSLPVYEADTTVIGNFDTELFVNIDAEGKFSLKLVCFTRVVEQREVLEKLVGSISQKCSDVRAFKASIN